MSLSSTFDLDDDDNLRRLLYLCAFVLFFLPYFQALAGLWPLKLGDVRWRFQAAGSLSGILMLPFLGLSLALGIARSVGQKGITRVVGVIGVLTVLGVAGGLGLFFLDALQLKGIVRDAAMADFMKAVATASMAMLISLCSYSFLSFVAFRSRKGSVMVAPKGTKKGTTDEPAGLLIGQDYTK